MKCFDLTGRVALVTGGNGGIGLGMAKALANAGAKVSVAGRNQEKNESAVKALSALGTEAFGVRADLLEEAACRGAIESTVTRFGRLDILINGAGIALRKPPEAYSVQEWHQVLDSNLTSAFICSQAAHRHMKSAGGGKIISIGSLFSVMGASFAVAYAASKGGLVQMTRALATAWAEDNIQVNTVLPGWIDTDLTRGAREQVPGLNDRVLARTPAKRWGRPADFDGITVLLSGPGSDFITGAAIPVDGGYCIQA